MTEQFSNEPKLFEGGCSLCGAPEWRPNTGLPLTIIKDVGRYCGACWVSHDEKAADVHAEITRRRAALAEQQEAKGELVHKGVVVRVGQAWSTANKTYPTVTLRDVRPMGRYVRFDSAYDAGGLDGASAGILQELVSDAEAHSPAHTPTPPAPPAKVEAKLDPSRLCAACNAPISCGERCVYCEHRRDLHMRGQESEFIRAHASLDTRIAQALEQLSRPLPSAHPVSWPAGSFDDVDELGCS